jgi:hypothetical protein
MVLLPVLCMTSVTSRAFVVGAGVNSPALSIRTSALGYHCAAF